MTGVLFRDAEAEVITHLEAALPGTVVCGRVPNPRPAQFIRIERLGGGRETRVTEATRIAVEGWAEDDTTAAALLNVARQHLFDVEGVLFGVDEYGGPVRLPDPTTNMSRYTASFTIRMRAIP
jgi:hypothetical protein